MKLFKKTDIIIIAAIIMISLILPFILVGKQGTMLEIKIGEKVDYHSLSENESFFLENEGITLEVTISGGKVKVKNANCPDKICVSTGEISKNGQMIICAPAKISIKITGGDKNEYDAFIG